MLKKFSNFIGVLGILCVSGVGLAMAAPALVTPGNAAKGKTQNDASNHKLSDPNKAIVLSEANPQFTLVLRANQTTGYSWFLVGANRKMIKPVSHRYQAGTTERLGASGYSIWQFKVKDDAFNVPQLFHLSLIYAQAWDLKRSTKVTFTVITRPKTQA